MNYPVWLILFSETGRNEGFWLVCNLYRSLSCLHLTLRLMSVAMTLPPFYAYRDNFSVTNCENFEAAGINGSRILN